MFDRAVFAARRDALMARLGKHAVAIVCSQPERLRNGDAYHVFRQASDVVYLTGFTEPQTVLVLRPGAETERVVMFVRPRDPEHEVWDGRRAGVEGAVSDYGADAAYSIYELRNRLPDLIANFDELHYGLGVEPDMDEIVGWTIARLRKLEKKGQRPPLAVIDPNVALHEMRLYKRPEELAALRTAADITCEAHKLAMRAGKPGSHEHEVEALLDFTFRRRGGNGAGYSSIVGAGANATVLHYVANNAPIADGDLVLVDAGCEYDCYTADVTRTWPANGRFTPEQRAVYEVVLRAQTGAIAMAKPGVTIDDIHNHCVRVLTDGMVELGLLDGPAEVRVTDGAYRKFYMHGTSHWLGLDVHDAGAYTRGGKPRPLEPGMVITIEPGLYVARELDHRLRGIGVRIEDDVLITDAGHEVLTAACPKAIDAVEAETRL